MHAQRRYVDFGRPISALRLVVGQILKGTCDIVAVTTGLKYRLLRHRARPTTHAERLQWEDVWRELITAEGEYRGNYGMYVRMSNGCVM